MRKIGIIFLLSCIISVTAIGVFFRKSGGQVQGEYIRIHVRADSDEPQAQAVKYLVRDALVAALTPVVAECESYGEAARTLKEKEGALTEIAAQTLAENGYSYGASVQLKREYFPTRTYGEYTLPAGEYLALVALLGKAEGQNWWCVVYPPLCFAGQSGVPIRYKSKIAEIIEEWKRER
jgi:stage II sporulation protein R